MTDTSLDTTSRAAYERDGFFVTSGLLDPALLQDAVEVMDRIIEGQYATGVEPGTVNWRPGDDPTKLVKIDQPQMADHAVTDMLRRTRIGEVAADLTGADLVQVWAVQLLRKPPAGTAAGNVGWHQDDDYWTGWWDGEVFTCWLALSDVTPDAGPMRFVRGSHTWGYRKSGNFWNVDMEDGREKFSAPEGAEWVEVPAVMPPGGASFHHRSTVHGSGPNTSGGFRRSYAVHLRTEKSSQCETAPPVYAGQLDDPALCPVLFER